MAPGMSTTDLTPSGPYVEPPAAASARPARPGWRLVLFAAVVGVPTFIAALYFLLIASPIYVSEARFLVRSSAQPPAVGLGSVLQGVALGQGTTDAYVVHEYITSRDAVADLVRTQNLRARLAPPGADIVSRFPRPFGGRSDEDLYRAWPRFVTVEHDATTGISTLRVRAFKPTDAQGMAQALLVGGERVVNQLNARAERDALDHAQEEVVQAQLRLAEAQAALAGFRRREGIIDPARVPTTNMDMVSRLSQELAALRAERAGLAASAPQSPQLPGLDNRIAAYQREIDRERSKADGETGSLAPKIGQYERLVLDRDFARQSLTSAMTAVESARHDARRQRLYLQRVVNPGRPDAPMLPHRWKGFFVVLLTSLLAYGALILVLAGLREHRQA